MNACEFKGPKRKLFMWYKVKELFEKGLRQSQICRELGLDKKTVRRYRKMSYEEFIASSTYHRVYDKYLDPYESIVYEWLDHHNDLSCAQVHDWLREKYKNFPEVAPKTVYNFVKHIRSKYNIAKDTSESTRSFAMLEETAYGEYAQVDFGERWQKTEDGRRVKVYFFAMVLCRSRKKFVWFSKSPFTAEKAIYAHEKAFEYYGGKPKRIIYDQDSVFIHSENYGDYILTKAFNAFVNQEHIDVIFCKKSDPQSKGKVENVVKYVKYNFLRGRAFYDIERLNDEAISWLSRTGNGLPHAITKQVPDEVFIDEKPHLTPYNGLPSIPKRSMKQHTVLTNNTIYYSGNYYSVPFGTYKKDRTKVWLNINEAQSLRPSGRFLSDNG